MTAVVYRRTGLALLVAALILGVCGTCRRSWESTSNQPARPVIADAAVDPTLTPDGPGARLVREQISDLRGTP